ncbi:hypothetical protein ACFVX9_24380 [Kitasatospora sp. NPDC058243]|uniref:hypothetical protein n=1 Tax=Kitasatospora sp. NPDC058243 TaxID=3346397 RepID=UPI0036D83159
MRGLRSLLQLGHRPDRRRRRSHAKGPERRPLLQAALQRLLDHRAGAILVPSKSAISAIEGEFNEFAERVEKASCFIQVATRR